MGQLPYGRNQSSNPLAMARPLKGRGFCPSSIFVCRKERPAAAAPPSRRQNARHPSSRPDAWQIAAAFGSSHAVAPEGTEPAHRSTEPSHHLPPSGSGQYPKTWVAGYTALTPSRPRGQGRTGESSRPKSAGLESPLFRALRPPKRRVIVDGSGSPRGQVSLCLAAGRYVSGWPGINGDDARPFCACVARALKERKPEASKNHDGVFPRGRHACQAWPRGQIPIAVLLCPAREL